MEDTQIHDVLRLNADDPAARTALVTAVDGLLASHQGSPRLSVALSGDRLPSETVAALVTALRRLRERGGAVHVAPATPAVRDALALTGLDRVFAFPLVPPETPHRFTNSGDGQLRQIDIHVNPTFVTEWL